MIRFDPFNISIYVFASIIYFVIGLSLAVADDIPVLKEQISVNSDILTLGDLFENAGPYKNVPVFQSPDVGKDGIISSERIQAAARSNGLEWANPGKIEKILIRRPSRMLSLNDIKSMLKKPLGEKIGVVDLKNLTIDFFPDNKDLHIEETNTSPFVIIDIQHNPQGGVFLAKIGTDEPDGKVIRSIVRGRALETLEVVVPIRPLEIGKAIKAETLKQVRVPIARLRTGAIKSKNEAIGKVPKYRLAANQILRKQDIEVPKIIHPNDLVEIKLESPGLSLKAIGRSLGKGALGDTISVLNTRSKRKIQAIVIAPGIVSPTGNSSVIDKKQFVQTYR